MRISITTFFSGEVGPMICFVWILLFFWVLHFPHEGKFVTIEQLSFFSSSASNYNVSYVGNTEVSYVSAEEGIFKDYALMGMFSLPPPNIPSINMIFVSIDPWIKFSPNHIDSFGDSMPLSPLEQPYQEIVSTSMVALESHAIFNMNLDTYAQSPWLGYWDSLDPLSEAFPINKSIVEAMYLDETPWNDLHHCRSFLLSLSEIPSFIDTFVSHNLMHPLQAPILVNKVLFEGNLGNITTTFPIDISVQPKILKIF